MSTPEPRSPRFDMTSPNPQLSSAKSTSYLRGLEEAREGRKAGRDHGKTCSQRLFVIKSLSVPLLVLTAIETLNAERFLGGVPAPEASLHAELFHRLRTLKDEYKTRLKPDATPFSLSVPSRILILLHEIVMHQLNKLGSDKVIR